MLISISSMSEYDEFLDKTSSEINMVLALLSIFLSAFERLFFLSLIIKVFVTLAISNKSPSFNFSRLSRYLLFQLSSSSQLHFSKSLMTASASFSDTIYLIPTFSIRATGIFISSSPTQGSKTKYWCSSPSIFSSSTHL